MQPHIKTEGNSNFQIGELKGSTVFYDFEKIKTYLNIKGHLLFGNQFKLYEEDESLLYKLCCYFVQDYEKCNKLGIDTSKGILLTGPVGCGKTSLMQLLTHLAPHKTKYTVIPTRNIVFNFNSKGFDVIDNFTDNTNYCFDDLGLESTGSHFANACEVMGEIILTRYDRYIDFQLNHSVKTFFTTNFNAKEIEKRYGPRVRSRLKSMVNLLSFDADSKDKRS